MSQQLPDLTTTIYLDSAGEITKNRYVGSFKIKRVLTNGDLLAIDRFYAKLLPKDAEESASEDRKIKAAIIAELFVRIIEGPNWWTESRYGQNMIEFQPMYDLIQKCNEEFKAWTDQLSNAVNKVENENSNSITPND